MPTAGMISSLTKTLRDKAGVEHHYWMMTAPTIFGNSGGAIFDGTSYELIGVLSRISAYNNFINIAVEHMGIFVPPSTIHQFLRDKDLADIVQHPELSTVPDGESAAVPALSATERDVVAPLFLPEHEEKNGEE